MGLDITAYSHIKQVPVDHLCDVVMDQAYEDGNVSLYPNPDFEEQSTGIERGIYSYKESTGFRAGSYGGYNYFRARLAEAGGYNDRDIWNEESPNTSLPFYWMVCFSDCEGVINAAHSQRLAREFRENRDRFVEVIRSNQEIPDPEYYFSKYDEWQEAFELASQDGAVDFH